MPSVVAHTWNLSSGRETEGIQGVHGSRASQNSELHIHWETLLKNTRWTVREGDISSSLSSHSPECTHKRECLQTYTHTRTHTHSLLTHLSVHTHAYLHTHSHIYIHHTCISTHICLHTCTYNTQTYTPAQMDTFALIHTYHTHKYTYMYTFTHTTTSLHFLVGRYAHTALTHLDSCAPTHTSKCAC